MGALNSKEINWGDSQLDIENRSLHQLVRDIKAKLVERSYQQKAALKS